MLMIAGMIRPCLSWVRALNALQNSMMLTPCWPSAGPTGGDGFAWPAGHWSFTTAMSFFATSYPSGFLDGSVVQHHGRGPAEDVHHDPQLLLVLHHLVHVAGEVGEGPADHAHVLALVEADPRLRLGGALL